MKARLLVATIAVSVVVSTGTVSAQGAKAGMRGVSAQKKDDMSRAALQRGFRGKIARSMDGLGDAIAAGLMEALGYPFRVADAVIQNPKENLPKLINALTAPSNTTQTPTQTQGTTPPAGRRAILPWRRF